MKSKRRVSAKRDQRTLRSRRRGHRARLERLEDRRLLAAIEVTTHLDTVATDQVTSLREAIDIANSNGEDDVITFAPSLLGRPIQVTKTSPTPDNSNVGGDLDIFSSDALVIQGNGIDETVITALGDSSTTNERVFQILGGVSVTFRDLTIRGGRNSDGAGISAAGNLQSGITTIDVRLTDNTSNGQGGAIVVATQCSATLLRTTIDHNSASGNGGAIANFGNLIIDDSEIFTNHSDAVGGGVFTQSDASRTTINKLSGTTLYDNTADAAAGGLASFNATTEITNSTFSENRTDGIAGALLNVTDGAGQTGTTTLLQSTIVGNQSGGTGNVHTISQNNATLSTLEFGNTVFIGNLAQGSATNLTAGSNAGGSGQTLASLGNNLLDDDGFGSLIASDIGNHDSVATPVIDPILADNGGPTRTHALINSSNNPAIDGGNDALAGALNFDQRGAFFQRSFGPAVDIGAVEHLEFDASDFVVTSIDDDGVDLNDDDVTLREAIFASNVTPGHQEITFSATIADMAAPVVGMNGTEYAITDSVSIVGPVGNQITVNGDNRSRIFHINDGDDGQLIDVHISHLALRNGKADNNIQDSNNDADKGGAIFSAERLELEQVHLASNQAALTGGAVFNSGPTRILYSTLDSNMAASDGGGIQSDGSLEIIQSSLIGNSAGGSGGGVKSNISTFIERSTFAYNSAGGFGGGWWTGAQAILNNSTFSGNTANLSGGGIRVDINSLDITNTTIVDNRSDADGSGGESGGGISTFNDDLTFLSIQNSIVAGNRHGADGSDSANDLGGGNAQAGSTHNLISDPLSSAGLVHDADGDLSAGDNNIVGADAGGARGLLDWTTVVEPLQPAGGTNETHPLVATSPAIDMAGGAPELASDQRGLPFRRNDGNGVDIGAFERQTLPSTAFVVTTLEDDLDPSDGELSLREAIDNAEINPGRETITFDASLFAGGPVSLALQLGTLEITTPLSIIGPGADTLSIQATSGSGGGFGIRSGSRHFVIDNFDAGTQIGVELAGMRLAGGDVPEDDQLGRGGAILNRESTTLREMLVEFNRATDGGAIDNSPGASLRVLRSTIANNSAISLFAGGGGGFGGGIFNSGDATLVLSQSTISGNSAEGNGGGIASFGQITIDRSTLFDNTAITTGGGLYLGTDQLTINGSILSGNRTDNSFGLANLNLNRGGETVDGDHNLVGSGDLVGGANDVLSDQPDLAPLAFNGGSTPTHAPNETSPAVNNAADAATPLVRPTSANSSTSPTDFSPASQLISRDGITIENYQTFRDGQVTVSQGWVTDDPIGPTGDYFNGTSSDPSVVFELEDVHVLTDIVIWGGTGENNNDAKTLELEFSVDNGVTFSTPVTLSKPRYSFDEFVFTLPLPQAIRANVVRMTVTDNYFGEAGQAGGDRVAMNEVRFLAQPTDQRGFPFVRDDGSGVDIGSFERPASDDLIDFGDAPVGYPVLEADDGARHGVTSLALGAIVNAESDGNPSDMADADDSDDGVFVIADMVAVAGVATTSSFEITATEAGLLDAWIDFNGDQDWTDAGEQIASSLPVSAGSNTLSFTVPGNAIAGQTAARFRLSSTGSLAPTGEASDGEVEDYLATLSTGSTLPTVVIDLNSSTETQLFNDSGTLTVRNTIDTLFSAPLTNIGGLDLAGTAGNDTIVIDLSGGEWIPPGGLILDGLAGQNTLEILGADLDLTRTNLSISNISVINLGEVTANSITVSAPVVQSASPTTQSVMVSGNEGDGIGFEEENEWVMGTTSVVDGVFFRQVLHVSGAELQVDLPTAWLNVVQSSDVDSSGMVTPLDALVVINELGRRQSSGAGSTLENPLDVIEWPGVYYDTNGDGDITPRDALKVINDLAVQAGSGEQLPAVLQVATLVPSPASGSSPRDLGVREFQQASWERSPTATGESTLPLAMPEAAVPALTARPVNRSGDSPTTPARDRVFSEFDTIELDLDLAFE